MGRQVPNCAGLVVLRRGAYTPSYGAVWTVALEMLNLGPPGLPACLLVACLLEMRVPVWTYAVYPNQSAKAAQGHTWSPIPSGLGTGSDPVPLFLC